MAACWTENLRSTNVADVFPEGTVFGAFSDLVYFDFIRAIVINYSDVIGHDLKMESVMLMCNTIKCK